MSPLPHPAVMSVIRPPRRRLLPGSFGHLVRPIPFEPLNFSLRACHPWKRHVTFIGPADRLLLVAAHVPSGHTNSMTGHIGWWR